MRWPMRSGDPVNARRDKIDNVGIAVWLATEMHHPRASIPAQQYSCAVLFFGEAGAAARNALDIGHLMGAAARICLAWRNAAPCESA